MLATTLLYCINTFVTVSTKTLHISIFHIVKHSLFLVTTNKPTFVTFYWEVIYRVMRFSNLKKVKICTLTYRVFAETVTFLIFQLLFIKPGRLKTFATIMHFTWWSVYGSAYRIHYHLWNPALEWHIWLVWCVEDSSILAATVT